MDKEKEEVILVVMRKANQPSYFDDDLTGTCSKCEQEVIYRPHNPKGAIKVCFDCATKGDLLKKYKIGITDRTASELRDYFLSSLAKGKN